MFALAAFSKEKVEDEMMTAIRLRSVKFNEIFVLLLYLIKTKVMLPKMVGNIE